MAGKGNRKSVKKGLGCLWIMVAMIFLIGGGVAVGVSQGLIGNVPDLSDLQNPISKSASRVYTEDGMLMCSWSYATENRIMIPYDSLPQNLVNALVAIEDERFYEHSGIDYIALGRAIVKTLVGGDKSAGGGSTITQQLAKQLYTDVAKDSFKRMLQKPIEWYIAVQIEHYYTKEEIISMYFNYFDFLYNAVGIKNAAETYFGKPAHKLTLEECATLVGMCKNPAYFNPYKYNKRCTERRDVVLTKMYELGYISKDDCDKAMSDTINMSRFHVTSHTEGIAPYYCQKLRTMMMAKRPKLEDYASWQMQQYHDDSLAWENDPLYGWCNKNTKSDGSHYNIYTDGLKIYTTIDSRMQKMAEDAVYKHVARYLQPAFNRYIAGRRNGPYMTLSSSEVDKIINREIRRSERYHCLKSNGYSDEDIMKDFNTKRDMVLFSYTGDYETQMTPRDSIIYYKGFLRSAMMAMDPHNGHVRAYVPGLDFKHFQYDNCLGGGRRQIGSTMKPILYSLALMNGFTPCSMVPTWAQHYGDWSPKGGRGSGYITMESALTHSNNQASAWLMNQMNPHNLVSLLREMGVGTLRIDPVMSLCLGPCDISVGELCSAYTAFANKGVRLAPMLVTRIEDADGNIVGTFIPRPNEVMNEQQAYQMITMMRSVVRNGTGRGLYSYGINADTGGKTGTTNSHADAWFMGVTPNLVVGTWVGGDDRDIHFNTMSFGQGARAALPIYGLFMSQVYRSRYNFGISKDDKFEEPEGFELCADELKGLHDPTLTPTHDPDSVEEIIVDEPTAIDESFR